MSIINSYKDNKIEFHYSVDPNPDRDDFEMHTHMTCEIYYFCRGNGVFHIEGNNYPLCVGDLLIMRPLESHYIDISPDTPYERIAVNVSVGLFDFCDPERALFKPFFERKSGQFNLYRAENFRSDYYIRILDQLKQKGNCSNAFVTGCVLSLLNELSVANNRNSVSVNSRSDVYKIIQYINRNIEKNLSLSDLCDRFFISKSVLCKKFKAATGSTVANYITTKKILRIQNLIESGKSIGESAQMCGINDYSTFYRAYKKLFGHSPSSAKN